MPTSNEYLKIGDEATCRVLLENGADVNARAGLGGHSNMTPLHIAAHNGHTSVVKMLLDHGSDVNAKRQYLDRNGITPLHLAAENGHLDAVCLLLESGANKDDQDSKVNKRIDGFILK